MTKEKSVRPVGRTLFDWVRGVFYRKKDGPEKRRTHALYHQISGSGKRSWSIR
ncbi:MAG: hypothetical protein HFF98_07770 [Oscillibacter sp.]|jgi:hypothetical protein|nr:hypothetical protein [Oscillibacter sp.]